MCICFIAEDAHTAFVAEFQGTHLELVLSLDYEVTVLKMTGRHETTDIPVCMLHHWSYSENFSRLIPLSHFQSQAILVSFCGQAEGPARGHIQGETILVSFPMRPESTAFFRLRHEHETFPLKVSQ